MSTKLIKVEILAPSGEWIAAQGESVGEATRDAIAKLRKENERLAGKKTQKSVVNSPLTQSSYASSESSRPKIEAQSQQRRSLK